MQQMLLFFSKHHNYIIIKNKYSLTCGEENTIYSLYIMTPLRSWIQWFILDIVKLWVTLFLQKEVDRRRRAEDAYKAALTELKRKPHYGGPDYEVSSQSLIHTVLSICDPTHKLHFRLKCSLCAKCVCAGRTKQSDQWRGVLWCCGSCTG